MVVIFLYFKGSRPEWCISSMIYNRDIPFWSGNLDLLCQSVGVWLGGWKRRGVPTDRALIYDQGSAHSHGMGTIKVYGKSSCLRLFLNTDTRYDIYQISSLTLMARHRYEWLSAGAWER